MGDLAVMETPVADGGLYGDLSSIPPAECAHRIQDIEGLERLLTLPGAVAMSERHIVRDIIDDRIAMLRQELAAPDGGLNKRIHAEVHHQLRARPDFQTDRIVIEQWVPALRYWLITCTYTPGTDHNTIIADLQAGDPRRKSPAERLRENREQAAARAEANEAASDDVVRAAVDSMSSTQISRFLEVERAIKTGETIIAHGPDLAFMERAHERTRRAAAEGDAEAQAVLTRGGAVDDDRCVNPGHNPNVR